MIKRRGLSLVLGGIALPLLASLPALAQQQPPANPPAATQNDTSGARNQMSASDRAAFLDARIAAVHAGLRLSADQEKFWPDIESAVRDGLTKLRDLREKMRSADRPADHLEQMSRRAEASIIRGEAMKRFTDAARPLYATLTDEQKRRLPLLMQGGRRNDRLADRGRDGGRFDGRDRDRDRDRGRFGPREQMDRGMMDRRMMDRGMMRRGDRDDGGQMQRRRWSDRDEPRRWD